MITTLLLLISIIFMDLVILSVDVLVMSIILLLISYKYGRKTQYDTIGYLVAMALAVTAVFIDIEIIRSGLIGFSLLNVVLFTGVLPNQWLLTKRLKTYRSFYSILGFIFIVPHALINLFVDQQINKFGVASLVIMIPLVITSFNLVRKEMKLEEWVKLQKAAYLVYILLFLHLISVADWYGKIVYAVMMTLYINNKLVKEYRK